MPQGGDLPGPQPLLLQLLVEDQGSVPCACKRARKQFTLEGPGRSFPAVPSPWVMGTAIPAGAILPLEQGRAAVSLMLL